MYGELPIRRKIGTAPPILARLPLAPKIRRRKAKMLGPTIYSPVRARLILGESNFSTITSKYFSFGFTQWAVSLPVLS
jgi:hypothetical protein